MKLQWAELIRYKEDVTYMNDSHVKLVANSENNADNFLISCIEGMMVVKTNCTSMSEIKSIDFEVMDFFTFERNKQSLDGRNIIVSIDLS